MPETKLSDEAARERARERILRELGHGPRSASELSLMMRSTAYHLAPARDDLLRELVAAGLVVWSVEPWGTSRKPTLTYRLAEPKGVSPDERT